MDKDFFKNRQIDKGSLKETIEESLKKIKSGDETEREKFIRDFRPFIIKVISKTVDKYVEPENSEEYSIALLAFNEAIEHYDSRKNNNFLIFSEQVIRRRLIDYKRQNIKNSNVYPFSYFDGYNNLEGEYFEDPASGQFEKVEFDEEMSLFKKKLDLFGITLQDLISSTPKHKDSRELSIEIARTIANDQELYRKLNIKKKLPVKELLKFIKVSRRTIERNKKYIIAVSLILKSDLEIFKEYRKYNREGGARFSE